MPRAGYGLTEEEKAELWRLISSTISTEGREFFVFGSRATESAGRFSDVDLGIKGLPLNGSELLDLEEAFYNSTFPYRIDIVQVHRMAERFALKALSITIPLGGSLEQVA